MISIAGTVREDARMLRTRDGRALLQLEVDAPNVPNLASDAPRPRSVTLRVMSDLGTGESAAYAAKARAQRLRRGVRVVVHGLGLQWARGGVSLQGLQRIDEPDLRIRNVTGEQLD